MFKVMSRLRNLESGAIKGSFTEAVVKALIRNLQHEVHRTRLSSGRRRRAMD